MQAHIESLSPTRVRLSVVADKSQLNQAKVGVISRLSANLKVPGFRPGNAPAAVAEKHLDPNSVSQETLEAALNSVYVAALVEHKLRPVNEPEVSVKAYVPYDKLEFSAEVEVIGEIKLGKYSGMNLTKPVVKVSADEVQEILKRLQDQQAKLTETKKPAKNGDQLNIDFSGNDAKDNQPISGADGKAYPLVLGSDTFIPGFEKNLIGLKVGDEKQFELTFPKDYGVTALRGKRVKFSVKVNQVSERKLPAIDDRFAKLVGPFANLNELKKDIRKELMMRKETEALEKLQNDIVSKLTDASEVSIPEKLIEEEAERIEKESRQNAAYAGKTWNEYLAGDGLSEADYQQRSKSLALSRIKMGLVLGEVASLEHLTVKPEEQAAQISQLKARYASDKTMQQELDKPENARDLKNRLLLEKTVVRLTELNTTTE